MFDFWWGRIFLLLHFQPKIVEKICRVCLGDFWVFIFMEFSWLNCFRITLLLLLIAAIATACFTLPVEKVDYFLTPFSNFTQIYVVWFDLIWFDLGLNSLVCVLHVSSFPCTVYDVWFWPANGVINLWTLPP